MEKNQIYRACRVAALQALFSKEFSEGQESPSDNSSLIEYTGTVVSIVDGVDKNKESIDCLITKYAKNWSISRINKIDLSILRIAFYEIHFSPIKINPAIIINEAVELAKEYGTDKSYKFINGILDAFNKDEHSNEK